MPDTALVIGAGITGISAACSLRRDGWRVTVIDRVAPGDPAQTSFGNAGLLARSAVVPVSEPGLWARMPRMLLDPSSPLFLRYAYLPRLLPWLLPFLRNSTPARAARITAQIAELTCDSVDRHQSLAAGTPAAKYLRTGDYAYVYRSRADYQSNARTNALKAAQGYAPDYLDRAALEKRFPDLGPAYGFAALYPDHGWITDPGAYVAALARHFTSNGGRFLQGEIATVTAGPRPRAILANGESLEAAKIILATGAWSNPLARPNGQTARVESERGYHLSMHDANITPAHPFMVADAQFVVTPMNGFLRAAGIVEFGGLQAPASQAPFDLLKKQLKQVFPTLTFARVEKWMGHRPTLPDSLPAIGESPDAPNIIHAYGGQHIGLTIGPRLGAMVAEIARGRWNSDTGAYRVGRRGFHPAPDSG